MEIMPETGFAERLEAVRAAIDRSAEKSGRDASEVELAAVTKTHGPEAVREAWDCGIRIMGENKVMEAKAKIPLCPQGVEWHLIGHLQRNKTRHAVSLFSMIHSVDSIELVEAIDRIAGELSRSVAILLEVNVSGEASKFGIKPQTVPAVVERVLSSSRITLDGFMTMAPFSPDPENSRPHFAMLRRIKEETEERFGIGLRHLSMGMSMDYAVAVEEGATIVRIGTALFGERGKWKPGRAFGDLGEF